MKRAWLLRSLRLTEMNLFSRWDWGGVSYWCHGDVNMTRSMHSQLFNLSSDSADVMRASKSRASLIFARCDTDVRVEEDELRIQWKNNVGSPFRTLSLIYSKSMRNGDFKLVSTNCMNQHMSINKRRNIHVRAYIFLVYMVHRLVPGKRDHCTPGSE